MTLELRNPHSILEAIRTRPKQVLEVFAPSGGEGRDLWDQVGSEAKRAGVRVSPPQKGHPDRKFGARVQPREPVELESLFSESPERGLWLAFDMIQDPQNLGAIFRSAAFFGARGAILMADRSAPMTSVVYDIACGGMEHVPFAVQANLRRSLDVAKEAGLWILGSSEHAQEPLSSVMLDRKWLLVLGNEEKGLRRLTEESCDVICKIPHAQGAQVGSLNVSVAAGILISHLSR